jgi:hypothetical protein
MRRMVVLLTVVAMMVGMLAVGIVAAFAVGRGRAVRSFQDDLLAPARSRHPDELRVTPRLARTTGPGFLPKIPVLLLALMHPTSPKPTCANCA